MIKKQSSKAPFVKPKVKAQSTSKIKDEEAILKFKLYLEAEKNSSDYTVISYIKDIEDFKDFLSSNGFGLLLEVDKPNIARYYISHLSERNFFFNVSLKLIN